MSAQQLCLDGLHDSLEPTAGTWKGQGNRLTWGLLGTGKALPSCGTCGLSTQQRTLLLLVSISPTLLGPGINPWFVNGAKKCWI